MDKAKSAIVAHDHKEGEQKQIDQPNQQRWSEKRISEMPGRRLLGQYWPIGRDCRVIFHDCLFGESFFANLATFSRPPALSRRCPMLVSALAGGREAEIISFTG